MRWSSTARACYTAKAPTTPADQSGASWRRSNRRSSAPAPTADQVESLAHGMTVGTNALLAERGATTALVATARL